MKAIENKTRILKFLSISLSIIMLLASLPNIVFAESTSLGSISADSNVSLSGSGAFLEDESMRDKFSKHYVLEDGSRFAVIFPEAVHYDDGNEWKEVDNRLTYNSKTGKYVSANPMFTTAFADNAASGELVSISDGEYTVSWSISFNKTVGNELVQVAASNSAASVQNGADVAEKLSEAKRLQASRGDAAGIAAVGTSAGTSPESVYKNTVTDLGKALSGISYENALDGAVSLRYSVMHQKIEEDIILRSKSDFASYTLTVNTGGLTVIAEDDGSIIFRNASGEAVFTIDAPWMQDSAYGFSKDIAVTVAQTGNTATVTYTPSAEWLSDEDRVYPVLIDPTFTTRDYTANYVDTHVLSGGTDYTYYDDMQSLYAGSSPVGEWKAYIKILNIPNINDDASYAITDATLCVWTTSSYNFPLTLSRTTSAWAGQTNIPEPTSRLIESNVSAVACSDGTYKYVFDLRNGMDQNYYFHNLCDSFKIEGASSESDTATVLNSSEAVTHRPILTLSYTSISNYFLNTDGVYSLKGYGTSNYMTTYNGGVSNGTNVCMGSPVSISTSLAQSYRFEYIAATDTWKIHAMTIANGYDKVIGFSYEDTVSDTGGYIPTNVELYPSNADNECIEWIIEPMNDTRFKIVSAYDPNLVLSFYGTTSWSGGNLPTANGNICVAQYVPSTSSGTNPGQYWELYSGGTMVTNGDNIAEIQTFEMNEYETYSFDVTVYGGYQRVSWSSSHPSVASVSNGQITAKCLGETTITATVRDEQNVVLNTYSMTLSVVLEDSVYYINNFADTTLFIQYSGEDKYTANLGSDTRPCMFKIYHLGDGKYSIRSMYDNKYGFTRSDDGELVHEEVGTEQEFYSSSNTNGVPEEAQWRISGSADDGYIIKSLPDPNGYLTLGSFGNISLGALATSNAAQKWNLTKSGFSGTGIEIYPSSAAVAVGDIKWLELAFYSNDMNKNAPSNVTWSVVNKTGSATINTLTGSISGVSIGTVTVNATCYDDTLGYKNAQLLFYVIPLRSGKYAFRNKGTEHYMQPDNDGASHIEQFEISGEEDQKWLLTYVEEQYYTIKNIESDLYLTAPSDDSPNSNIVQQSFDQNIVSRQLWKITPASDSAYKIQAKSQENTSLVLTVGDGFLGIDNGINIVQKEYSNDDNYKDEWNICHYVSSSVGVEAQEESSWCWAATARMFAKHYYPEVSITQEEGVIHVMGSSVDEEGTILNATDAMSHYISNIENATLSLELYGNRIYSESVLRRFINNYHVIYAAFGYYELIYERRGGHAMLIYGYIEIPDGTIYLLRDPAPEDEGSTRFLSYDELLSDAEDGRNRRWEGCIVVSTHYSYQTILFSFEQ